MVIFVCFPVKAKSQSIKARRVCLIEIASGNVTDRRARCTFDTRTKVTKVALFFQADLLLYVAYTRVYVCII
jgi:hypothetical protein